MADPPDLTTTGGVIEHVRARIEEIYNSGGLRGVPSEHRDAILAAKETAYIELFAELFKRVKAFEPKYDTIWRCQVCSKPTTFPRTSCSNACYLKGAELLRQSEGAADPHSSS